MDLDIPQHHSGVASLVRVLAFVIDLLDEGGNDTVCALERERRQPLSTCWTRPDPDPAILANDVTREAAGNGKISRDGVTNWAVQRSFNLLQSVLCIL